MTTLRHVTPNSSGKTIKKNGKKTKTVHLRVTVVYDMSISFATPGAGQVDPFQDQRKLSDTHLQPMRIRRMSRQSKYPLFKTLVPKGKTTAVPKENLTSILSLVEKHKQMAGERVLTQYRLSQHSQPVKAIPHVRSLSRNEEAD
jgi:hypothetical protein